MFSAALFTGAETWEEPRRPSVDERMEKQCVHAMGDDSAINRTQSSVCSNTDGPREHCAE